MLRRELGVQPLDQLVKMRVVAGGKTEQRYLAIPGSRNGRTGNGNDFIHATPPHRELCCARLAEPAGVRAAAHNLDHNAIVDGLEKRHQWARDRGRLRLRRR